MRTRNETSIRLLALAAPVFLLLFISPVVAAHPRKFVTVFENLYNSKLSICVTRKVSERNTYITLDSTTVSLPVDSGLFSFLPPRDSFSVSFSDSLVSTVIDIRLTEDSLIFSMPENEAFELHNKPHRRIPKMYKNRLYWVTYSPYPRDRAKGYNRYLVRALTKAGAVNVSLEPGDYYYFKSQPDSILFFTYPGLDEQFRIDFEAIAKPFPFNVILSWGLSVKPFCDPTASFAAGAYDAYNEADTAVVLENRGFRGRIYETYPYDAVAIRIWTKRKYKGVVNKLVFEVRETDEAYVIAPRVLKPTELCTDDPY